MSAAGQREQGAMTERIAALLAEIDGVPVIADPTTVRRRSRDFFWYSPILNAQLAGKSAEIIVTPRNEEDVIRVARACVRRGVALTPRGGGTGNYGQAVPLEGGVLIDISAMDRILRSRPGVLRVEPGAKMHDIDAALRPSGWELRMHPSTKRTATIGGFVAGGSGGVGSITYGGLREPGNVLAARIVTMERRAAGHRTARRRAPRRSIAPIGTTGMITALEMPLAPAWPWIDVIVAFDGFHRGGRIGLRRSRAADGVVKKLLTPIDLADPAGLSRAEPICPEGKSLLDRDGRGALAGELSGRCWRGDGAITYEAPTAHRGRQRRRSTNNAGTTRRCTC